MKKLTGSADEALKVELDRYKRFIVKRSSFYADLDDSNVINESYIQKAAKEYNNNYIVSRSNREYQNINFPLFVFLLVFSVIMLVMGLYCIIRYSDIVEHFGSDTSLYFFTSIVTLFASAFMFMILFFSNKKQRNNSEKERSALRFLNKWYEVEYVLQDMYEKKYEKSAGNIKDLLFFYIDLPEVRNSPKATAIFSLLEYRNSIIHKKTDKIDISSIDSSIKELDDILDILKDIEVPRKKNELL